MRLYLVQHGDALPKEKNEARPLSDRGRRDIERLASFLARGGVKVGRTVDSGKRRASETALILAKVIGPGAFAEQVREGLDPNDSTETMVKAVAAWAGGDAVDTMIVGHMPNLGKLAARLMTSAENGISVGFQPGTIACLDWNGEDPNWKLVWMIRPELLGR